MIFTIFGKSPKIKVNNKITIINCVILKLLILFLLLYKRLIVQLVERTAHNGPVIGSNPVRPSFKKYEFKFKIL